MNKKRIIAVVMAIIFLSISTVWYYAEHNPEFRGKINEKINEIEGKTLNKNFQTKIKSGNLSTDYKIEEALNDIEKLSLNTVNIPVVINIKNLSSSDMTVNQESLERAKQLIKKLRWKKINIIIEPYPWIDKGQYYETDWMPNDINAFFWNWKTNVLKVLIDEIAVPYHVDALVVASNFVHMEYAEGYWCDLIDYVRTYYKGLITYKTCWWYTAKWDPTTVQAYEKKLNNKLFGKVDYISIAAYFELTDKDTNTVENLEKAIRSTQIFDRKQDILAEIKSFHDKWKKPIFFGELGFPRTNKASVHPWDPYQTDVMNEKEQANCFAAYKKTFENEPWLLGFSIFAIGEHGPDKRYYPGSEAAKIIKSWYFNQLNKPKQ
ncbi:glycoside hydrolase family 113 [Fonticella tunisiensis]|uniref:Hydrolase n=1 Tax=Fonticella tunisiensis TaxID=1096341 RepID=A0A4R7KXC8_9CLOT|nr:hydrolase [Fonticella tunisiensis]TDT63596.1 hypothetical protein EDD71_10120 [Fonticella tunisiensis]